jgi:RNA polymerase sigma-70 factor (ECF subfamily)
MTGSRVDADEVLVRSVFEEHGRALLAYATKLLGDRQAAEDVVQEVLVRVWKHPEVLLNGRGSVRGWLLTVTRNVVIDRARAAGVRPREVVEPTRTPVAAPDHAGSVVDSMVLTEALSQLSDEHREVLVELYFKGSSVREASDALEIPAGTVRSRCFYALKLLRQGCGMSVMLGKDEV